MPQFQLASFLLACVPLVASHGGGQQYTIDNVVHSGAGADVLNTTTSTIQRLWSYSGFDQRNNLTDALLACGDPGTPSEHSYHAPHTAGSTISIDYIPAGSNQPTGFDHPYGPMLAYMAACPAAGCEAVDTQAQIWFKIWQVGLRSGEFVSGDWAMRDIQAGQPLAFATPKTLRPGKYLLRHEMVNLQTGPVQVFPNCVQLDVKGRGDSVPDKEALVAFPGAYEGNWGLGVVLLGA
ncbi:glycoside hydrolase [Massariosphaeria phaeospora]|uniref:AA9 family lytic polysaccharide monooxygenase n=1 Tax=Massariosphaeria phaeospora TaxID=100035 RepID=A0A7C8M891_9PLEO|nr:glycoside hydrolase [Massariosphaeria phaeospora]